MANFISTSAIVDPTIGQPWTGPELNYLQLATSQQIAGIIAPLIHTNLNNSGVTILQGCTYTVTGTALNPTYNIASGYCWANNTLYYNEAASVTVNTAVTSANTVVATLFTSDPIGQVTFSDGINRTVFQNTTIACNPQASGTGFNGNASSDFLNWENVAPAWQSYSFPASAITCLFSTACSAQTSSINYKVHGRTMFFQWAINASVGSGGAEFLIDYSSLFEDNNSSTFRLWTYSFDNHGNPWEINSAGNLAGGRQLLVAPVGGGSISPGVYGFNFNGVMQID